MIETKNETTEMTVEEMRKYLSWAYVSLIKSGKDLKRFPSVMLWGAPGVGKSQGVRQIAKVIEEKTEKKVVVIDVRLLLFNPVDLRGIPTANAEKTLAVWLKPKIFQMDDSPNIVNILFLDEISAAPPSVQAAAYQITLDRTVGEHTLPDNCIVIAAGNRVTDKSVAYNMPKALANRLLHIDVVGEISSWRRWAIAADIHPLVIGFLDRNPSLLMVREDEETGNAFHTPRSWEMVSNILNDISPNVTRVLPLIKGCIGGKVAYLFRTWAEIYEKIPSPEDICSGKQVGVPVRTEALYATVSAIVTYLTKHYSESNIDFAVAYVRRFKKEEFQRYFLQLISEVRNSALAAALNRSSNFIMMTEYFNFE